MKFSDWLKLKEVGTGTGDVAVFARPIIGGPLATRKWPWNEDDPFFKKKKKTTSFGEWVAKLNELYPTQAVSSVAQTLPQGNQPTQVAPVPNALQTVSLSPVNYKGNEKVLYNNAYQKFVQTKNQNIGNVLYKAMNGDDSDLMRLDNQTGTQFKA